MQFSGSKDFGRTMGETIWRSTDKHPPVIIINRCYKLTIPNIYPPVIKDGLLENGPLIGDMFFLEPPFLRGCSSDPCLITRLGKPLFPYAFSMIFPFSHGFSMIFPFSHGFSYGFSMIYVYHHSQSWVVHVSRFHHGITASRLQILQAENSISSPADT